MKRQDIRKADEIDRKINKLSELEKYINFFKQQYRPEEIRLEWLNGKAPCGKCFIQNDCDQAMNCEIYQKWRRATYGS